MSITELFTHDSSFPKEIFMGVTVGVVTDIDDPDKLGRIKVKLLNRDTSIDETDFIRIATPMTGKEWGMFFFPEVGDEVLLAFGGGQLSRPYVIGSLWNQNYKPPVQIKDKKNIVREIKTKNGHQIIFHDEDNKDFIEIATPKRLKIKLDDEKNNIVIQDKDGKNIVKIDSQNGIITIEGEKKINICSGNSKLLLDGSANTASLQSKQSLKISSQQIIIEAKGTLDLKATGGLNMKSDGPASLKGAVVKLN